MVEPLISAFERLRGLEVFGDYRRQAQTPQFLRYNVIYGFNGSGKSTLSRIFASLGAGERDGKLPAGEFTCRLSDGSRVGSEGGLEVTRDKVAVFNADFVEQNLDWNEDRALPVYIGSQQVELGKELEAKEAQIAKMAGELAAAMTREKEAYRAFTERKKSIAREIFEDTRPLNNAYNAGHLERDYSNRKFDRTTLDTGRLRELKSVVNQSEPKPALQELGSLPEGVPDLVVRASRLLGETVGTFSLAEVDDHPEMAGWIRQGFEYHESHSLETCLHCGNNLTQERREALAKAFDDRFERLVSSIDALAEKVGDAREWLRNRRPPSANDLSDDLTGRYSAAVATWGGVQDRLGDAFAALAEALELKRVRPNVPIEAGALPDADGFAELVLSASESLSAINDLIAEHNRHINKFSERQSAAREKLKDHHLTANEEEFWRLHHADSLASEERKALDANLKQSRYAAEEIRNRMWQHGPAAHEINRLARSYLGHGDLALEAQEEGYLIRRRGEAAGNLSEGEKTALALCYFLITLEADGRKLGDLAVVIDDPISSLDSKALNYAFNLIKQRCKGVGQLFLLTHNLQFLSASVKWLRKRTAEEVARDKQPSASFHYLDMRQDLETGRRRTDFTELPQYIRNYSSEYHFLFHLILKFENGDGGEQYFYLLPNALRKVLEIFLSFKIPGHAGLGNKINEMLQSPEDGLDLEQVAALERLIQAESHGDLIQLEGHTAPVIEEIHRMVDALFHLMKIYDRDHFERMKCLCEVKN